MDIRFCALSNESIPDSDFENGRAVTVDGKSYYVHHAMAKLLKGGGGSSWITLLLALFAAGVGVYLLTVHLSADKADPNLVPDAVKTHVAAADQAIERRLVEVQRTSVETVSGRVRTQLTTLQTELDDLKKAHNLHADLLGKRATEVSERMDQLQVQVEAMQKDLETVRGWMTRIETLAADVKELREAQLELAARPAAGPQPEGPDGGGPEPQDPDPDEGPDPDHEAALKRNIELLGSKNNNLVFTATVALAELGDLRAVPPLIKVMTRHADFYARLGAATALGTLKSVDAVPELINALNDKDDLVRVAAHDALVLITGQDMQFSSSLSRNERTRKQREWRKWFKDNEASLREKLEQPAK